MRMNDPQPEQLPMFPEQEKETECCFTCRHFAEFKKPVQFDGYTIEGYCFKYGGKGLPVYIAGAKCKDIQGFSPVCSTRLKGRKEKL